MAAQEVRSKSEAVRSKTLTSCMMFFLLSLLFTLLPHAGKKIYKDLDVSALSTGGAKVDLI